MDQQEFEDIPQIKPIDPRGEEFTSWAEEQLKVEKGEPAIPAPVTKDGKPTPPGSEAS